MKNGKPILIGALLGIALYEAHNSKKFKQQIQDVTTMSQYRNRLSEFYDQDNIDQAFKEMTDYIGFGVSPSAAFKYDNDRGIMIDLCVVNYNTRKLLQRFLDTLHGDLYSPNGALVKNWNLYITDNDSTDDFIPWIREHDEKYSIDRLYLRQNIGYSAAVNMMASKSSSDIIGILNGDVWMTSEDCIKIENIFNENQDIHILGPKQRDENGFVTHAGIIGTNTAPKHRGWREYDANDILYKDRVDCVTVSGSAYFIRRSVWDNLTNNSKYRELYPDAIGAFLPTPHYYEETWCSYFARHLGYNVVYDGSVSIGHSWHASTPRPGEGVSQADKYFPISREIFRRACDHIGIERD